MLFNSVAFLLYLPIVFLLYWYVFKKLKLQNAFVVVASYIFYGWWDWKFLILIFFTSLCSYASGLLIDTSEHKKLRRLYLWINVIINAAILCLFKYYNFFASNLQYLLQSVGIQLDDVTLNIILPVGISFYTLRHSATL